MSEKFTAGPWKWTLIVYGNVFAKNAYGVLRKEFRIEQIARAALSKARGDKS